MKNILLIALLMIFLTACVTEEEGTVQEDTDPTGQIDNDPGQPDNDPVDNKPVEDTSQPDDIEEPDDTNPPVDEGNGEVDPSLLTPVNVSPTPHTDGGGNSFQHYQLLAGRDIAWGPAVSSVVDIDNDGNMDFFVSHYGPFDMQTQGQPSPAKLTLFRGTGDLGSWNTQEIITIEENFTFPQKLEFADIDGDGDTDFVVPGGFLVKANSGAIFWYEQVANGHFNKHIIIENTPEFFHQTKLVDLDGDGHLDLLAGAETGKTMMGGADSAKLWIFKGNGSEDRFDKTPVVLHDNFGSTFFTLYDVDGDGKDDVVSSEFFIAGESFAWLKNPGNITSTWQKYLIDDTMGPGFGIAYVENLFGEGQGAFVGTNHTNTTDNPEDPESAVFYFEIPEDPTQKWTPTIISNDIISRTGKTLGFELAKQMAPGMFGYGDVNGDGNIDITVSGDGDSRIFWYENNGDKTFTEIVFAGEKNQGNALTNPAPWGQCGGMNVTDLDNDGKAEILINSWEGHTINIFEFQN